MANQVNAQVKNNGYGVTTMEGLTFRGLVQYSNLRLGAARERGCAWTGGGVKRRWECAQGFPIAAGNTGSDGSGGGAQGRKNDSAGQPGAMHGQKWVQNEGGAVPKTVPALLEMLGTQQQRGMVGWERAQNKGGDPVRAAPLSLWVLGAATMVGAAGSSWVGKPVGRNNEGACTDKSRRKRWGESIQGFPAVGEGPGSVGGGGKLEVSRLVILPVTSFPGLSSVPRVVYFTFSLVEPPPRPFIKYPMSQILVPEGRGKPT
ncbi:hypothetical protein DFH09DRAFT_1090899 [Mycena vulgaris]|nr:hypothetical protein DFH09DRAFT_1090899 [Mycena vulgaris]